MVAVHRPGHQVFGFTRLFGYDVMFLQPPEEDDPGNFNSTVPVMAYAVHLTDRVRLPEIERHR